MEDEKSNCRASTGDAATLHRHKMYYKKELNEFRRETSGVQQGGAPLEKCLMGETGISK
jgi:hypothetical protein